MKHRVMEQFYSVLTNGETDIEIYANRFDCTIDPREHIFGQDRYGNMYIDGKLAHIEIRKRSEDT